MSRPLPLGVVSVKCHSACDLKSDWNNHFTSVPEWIRTLRTCICKTWCTKISKEGQICLLADDETTQAFTEGVHFIIVVRTTV